MVDQKRIDGLKEIWIAKIQMLHAEYFSARRKLERAEELCPELDNVEEMLKVCDILIFGANTEVLTDLRLNPSRIFGLFLPADVKTPHEKLLDSLNSIKDELPGTDRALEILHDAFKEDSEDEMNQEGPKPFDGSAGKYLIDSEGLVHAGFPRESQPEEEQEPVSQRINPKKGEIWAMYKNKEVSDEWSSEYYAVEIMSGFCDENGVMVCKLVAVGDYGTIFQRARVEGFAMVREISIPELMCFSHRIPAFRLNAGGAYGTPEEAWHLDPDAIPVCRDNSIA